MTTCKCWGCHVSSVIHFVTTLFGWGCHVSSVIHFVTTLFGSRDPYTLGTLTGEKETIANINKCIDHNNKISYGHLVSTIKN